jgi:hypothetical protein
MTRILVTGIKSASISILHRTYRSDPAPVSASAPNSTDMFTISEVVWRVLALVAFVFLTFPSCFGSFGSGLDSSWATAMNELPNRHMIFGRDIAFTYGPLGFVITPRDIGSNIIQAIIFRLGLHLFWWTSVGMLIFRTRGLVSSLLFAAASALSGIHFGPEWDVNYQLTGVINLTILGYLVLGHIDRRPIWGVAAAIVAAAAILAKFNIGVACTGAGAVWAVAQFLHEPSARMLRRLGLVGLIYVSVLVGLFQLYGGPIDALPHFFKYSHQIASGYSSQMTFCGPETEVKVLSAVLGIAVFASVAGILTKARYTPVLLIILFPLFVLFKSAIVRHDSGHFLTSSPVIVGLSAFLLPGRNGRWHVWTSQAVVALALLVVTWFIPSSVESMFTRGALNWVETCKYVKTMESIRAKDAQVKKAQKLPASFLSRIGSAPMDVYPWDVNIAVANRLNWKPRFVFQSYSAYTPILDKKSADSYRTKSAPKFILYKYQSIDNQHPCIVDTQTWTEICRWYKVVDQANDILLLQRRETPTWNTVQWMGSKSIEFGHRWQVPEVKDGQIFLQAKMKISPLGRLNLAFYKVYPPSIRIEYRDGPTEDHRLVWQNVESGFLVSSLPRGTDGVRRLLENGEADHVRSVSFLDDGGCFEKKFHISWYQAPCRQVASAREVAVSTIQSSQAVEK